MIIIVEGVQRWNMTDEETGRPVTGTKIFVKATDSQDNFIQTPDKEGSFPTTFNLPYEDYSLFAGNVPGIFDVDFTMKVGSKGQFTVKRAEFIEYTKATVTE